MRKKIITALIVCLAIVACVCGLAACGYEEQPSYYLGDGHECVFTNYKYNKDGSCVDGTETALCDLCKSKSDTRVKVGSAVGHHVYKDYVCIGCGDIAASAPYTTDILVFQAVIENRYAIGYSVSFGIDHNSGPSPKYIKIPAEYEGMPVIEVSKISGSNDLESIFLPEGIVKIGKSAFSYCYTVKNINIPNSVKEIGYWAFGNCMSLKNISIPSSTVTIGQNAFYNCRMLESITVASDNPVYHSAGNCLIETGSKTLIVGCKNSVIPADGSVISIEGYAFYGCEDLTSIEIPDSVTNIGRSSFEYCRGLTSIEMSNSITSIEESAFYGCSGLTSIEIPDNVTNIEKSAFGGCSNLETVYWNAVECASVYSEDNLLFKSCSKLTMIVFGDRVTSIPAYAFYGCGSVTSITISNGVKNIGESAFEGCGSVTNIEIPKNVTSIERYAFRDCGALKAVYWNATACASAGSNNGAIFSLCRKLTSIIIGDNVTVIPQYAFSRCTGVKNITIPNCVTSIGNYAFKDCSSLETVYWNAVACTSAGSNNDAIFYNCKKLTSIIIGDDVIGIPSYAFSNCGLTSINLPKTLKTLGENALPSSIIEATAPAAVLENLPLSIKKLAVNGGKITAESLQNLSCLETLTLADGLTGIGSGAYSNISFASGIETLVVPETVTEIEVGAFAGLSGLIELTLPFVGATDIPSNVSIPIPAKNVLGAMFGTQSFTGAVVVEQAFAQGGTTGLTFPFYIPSSLVKVTVKGKTFHNIEYGAFSNCTGLKEIKVENAQTIKAYAFYNCTGIEAFTIGVEVSEVSSFAFHSCTSLSALTIAGFNFDDPNYPANNSKAKMLMIRNGAFKNCTSLTHVTFPERVISISGDIFEGCTVLARVEFKDVEWLLSVDGDVFTDYTFSIDSSENVAKINAVTGIMTIVNKMVYTESHK